MKYTPADKVRQIWTPDAAKKLIDELWETEFPVGLDTETEGCDPKTQSPVFTGKIACWSLAYIDPKLGKHKLRGIPLAQSVFIPNWGEYAELLELFRPWLTSAEHKKVGHNIFTFDRHIFMNHGITLNGIHCDTLRLAKLLYNNKAIRIDLKRLMAKNLLYSYGEYKELFSAPGILDSKHTDKDQQTWRKIGDVRVPTYIAAGEHCRFSYAKNLRRVIPLTQIDTEAYRGRMNTLIEYASLDAKAALELYIILQRKAAKT